MAASSLKLSTEGLTDKQALWLAAWVQHRDVQKAATEAGYSDPTIGYQVIKSPNVQAAIRDYNTRLIGTDLATLAVQTVKDLMAPGNPGSVRLGASTLALKMARYLDDTKDGDDRDPNTMTPDELAEQIGRLDAALAKHADAAIPVKTQVIEHNPPSGG